MKRILGIFLIASLGGLVSLGTYKLIELKTDKKSDLTEKGFESRVPVAFTNYSAMPTVGLPDFTKAANRTIDAVVHIKTEYVQKNPSYEDFFGNRDPLYDFFWGNPWGSQNPIVAYGSGVIIADDGYIVTNNHVVQDADQVEVTLNDKRTFKAQVIGSDPTTDLALIKIDEKSLPFIVMGDSDSVKIGEWVLAVGNPFNLTSTVTAGIISAKGRNINILGGGTAIESFIQTDAAVNRGNSGGALVNIFGDLIGINAAIASNTGSYSGYSFAIPVNIVKKIVDDLMVYGEVQRAYLGIEFVEITSELAKSKSIEGLDGVYVVSVRENSSAAKADIQAGDIILKINGQTLKHSSEVQEIIGRHRPGDKINVTLNRIGKELEKEITLTNKFGTTESVKKGETTLLNSLGATFEEVSEQEKQSLNIDFGVKIVELNRGKLRAQGIREGFIITHVNNKEIHSIEDLEEHLKNQRGGVLIAGVYPNGMRAYYGMGL